ncbi:hypothetical protein UA08_02323 [Talaromyces atroroseus]|uniref:FAD dependent oxidoreductase domain-containing protein n=1 Tax=Talaromyces atroroseus TaxID=1441469 RepID=A0A225B4I9_TALAT|nr:hypothetical protein UA08_02323 [Talaromyces atroroseus]OKL62196.1 hypothetical protein UA08_02323 [Talaromyces atroroseus]
MQPLAKNSFNPAAGLDSASADINKIMRLSYGTEIDYQRLAYEAGEIWKSWNKQIELGTNNLPAGLEKEDKLWYSTGMLRMSATEDYGEFELRTLENMQKEGLREMQYMCDNPEDILRARSRGWGQKLDPLDKKKRLGYNTAVLDSTAGFVAADKACHWVWHLCQRAGVHFVQDPTRGKVTQIVDDGDKVIGIKTADGLEHHSDMVIVACGGWTPTLIPEVRSLLETTAGSVATIHIDEVTMPHLWQKYAPENMPVLTWGMKEGKGVYMLPRTKEGVIKFGYRATKWTNYDTVGDGQRISVPKTAHVTDKKESNIPKKSLNSIKEFISINTPDLLPLEFSATKLCWYTDSIDNSFVIDHVPNKPGMFVCSGGSGHGFKFLPILGREIVPILEGRGQDTVYGKMWRWREDKALTLGNKRNGLQEGEGGPRVLAKQDMASPRDWRVNSEASRL